MTRNRPRAGGVISDMKRVAIVAVLLGLAGCAGQATDAPGGAPDWPTPSRSPVNLVPDGYQGRFSVSAMVLEDESHGPQLCTAVGLSHPPRCGGPDVIGWTWDGLRHSSAGTSKWGSFDLVGTWDGKSLALTEPPSAFSGANTEPPVDFTSPCTPPPGGWKPLDAAKATSDDLQAAQALAMGSPDFAGLWIDETPPPDLATPMNNPARLVLNVRFTKDLDKHEARLRQVWGGSLCVSPARHTEAELRRIQDELTAEGVTFAGADVITGTVDIGVWVAYESRQRELDAKYGDGLVRLVGTLKPID